MKPRSTPQPGYDELRDPLFIGVMLLALITLALDLAPEAWASAREHLAALLQAAGVCRG